MRGRLAKVQIDDGGNPGFDKTVEYKYNDSGIRVSQTANGTLTKFVIDPNNHTGYAQVLEELDTFGAVVRSYLLGHDVLSQFDSTHGTLWLIYDGHGSTRGLVDALGQPLSSDVYAYDAYGNLLGFAGTPKTVLLYSGEWRDLATGLDYLRYRPYSFSTGRFLQLDPFPGDVFDPLSLHKYLYANADPIQRIDPSGGASLTETIVTAGIRSALTSLAIGAPFRAFEAGYDLAAGASLRDVALQTLKGALFDLTLGAVLGGGAAGLLRQFGSNAFKIRAAGQSIVTLTSARLPWSAWRLGASARGLAIEKSILNRAAGFLGRQIRNFPVIDDFVIKNGRGIATSIKSLDLTADSYQVGSQLLSKLNTSARELLRFQGTDRGFRLGARFGGPAITDKVLVVAFEQGAATSVQAQTIARFLREAPTKFPGVKVVVQFVP